jgi:co-chaperonin GroES (HSP10)
MSLNAIKVSGNPLLPCGDRVLVEVLPIGEEQTPGGLVVPSKAMENGPRTGRVIEVSPTFRHQDHGPLAVGDFVLFNRNAGLDLLPLFQVPYRTLNGSEIINRAEKPASV